MKEDREIVPLRTILQNCLNHIENLESNRSICDNYEKEFQDLKQFSETLKSRKEFACTEGEKEVNRKKNRYKDILPFNVSRVILSKYAGIPGSDYINANYIKGASGSPAYIASQGPLPNTVNDFWRMVVECEVQVIVMACNAEEAGKHKCENYWVEKEGEEKRFGMVEICLVKASTVCPDFLVRTMRLKYTNDKSVTEERTICQFHYSAWPDHGVPPLVRPLLDMVRLVRDTQASETLPVLVHCSAGCGRTGTICAIDFVWGLLRAGKLTEEFSLFNLVKDMRKQRVAMVQTKEQYILVHQAVRELFKEQLRVIESHPYENIDVNGIPLIKDYEEPLYDTIGPSKKDFDEKKDENEVEKSELEKKETPTCNFNKFDLAPPLPRKKRPNIPFSKQEKEVENLTEKNRCSAMEKEKENLDESAGNSLLSKPRIAKLKALFERSPTNRERNSSKLRGSQTVSRSHSLGAIRKPLFPEIFDHHYIEKYKPSNSSAQPIPDGGKLKVPKLSLSAATVGTKPIPLIKRSKSLKAISQPQKLTTVTSNSNSIRDTQNQLRIVNKTVTKENVSTKKHETISKATFKKSLTTQNLQKTQFSNELYKRRRSLESLIGDEPPVITWPTTVMHPSSVVSSNLKIQCNRNSSELISISSKSNSKGLPGIKDFSTESIKQQFQNLSIEAQKKMNTFAAGIGIRERRNSFRQAISRDDEYVARENHAYEYIWLDLKKSKQKLENKTIHVNSYPENFNNKLTVRNQNGDILNPISSCDQLDGINARKEELSYNFNQTTNKKNSDYQNRIENTANPGSKSKPSMLQRGKPQIMKLSNETYYSRFSHRPHETASTFSSHTFQDKTSAFSSVRANDDARKIIESKNLFLQRLNSEIQEGKNLRMPINKDDNLSTNSKLDAIPIRRGDADYAGISESSATSSGRKFADKGAIQDSLSGTKWKKLNTVRINSDDHKGNEAVWNHGRQFTPTKDKTVKSIVSSSISNSNFLGIHSFGKTTNETQKSQNTIRETQTSSDTRKGIHRNINSTNRTLDSQTLDNENSSSRPIKDSYIDMDKKIHRDWIAPRNKPQKSDLTIKSQSTRHTDYPAKSYDSHNEMSSQSNSHIKKSLSNPNARKPQIIEVQKKNFLSGANSLSSHSSGDLSHSDQFSQTSESPKIIESHEVDSTIKPEVIRLRSNQLRTFEKKVWIDDSNKHEHESESSSSSSVRELTSVLPIKPSEESYNYGIVASVKLRPSKPNHSRDDFVLGEPVAPPRVKRHASVKITRQGGNDSNVIHLSTWTSPDKRTMETNNWNDALGVDLDAVAASIQKQKAECSGLNEASQLGNKNHNSSGSTQYSFKKQQHYL